MAAESGDMSQGSETSGTPQSAATGADVFISYGSDDVALARELRGHLEQGGYGCWMAPDDVAGPKTWAEQIVEAIGSCKVMLVLISSVSNASNHVSKEVDLALEHGKAVLPVRVEDVAPAGALRYLLALAQWIDAFPGPLGPHAEEVRRRVAAIVGADTDAATIQSGAVVPPIERESTEEEQFDQTGPSNPHRRKWLIGAIAAAILVVLGVGVGLLVAGGDDEPPYVYGDDAALDDLWDACNTGELSACDQLFATAPYESEYSYFGETCGDRYDGGGECATRAEFATSFTYGDNAELDELWDACNGENFAACNALYDQSPFDSEYEQFGGTCGYRTEFLAGCPPPEPTADLEALRGGCAEGSMEACWELFEVAPAGSYDEEFGATCGGRTDGDLPCVFTLGDSPWLDELWNACSEGAMEECDLLYEDSPVGSEYEEFGRTCGWRVDDAGGGECVQR